MTEKTLNLAMSVAIKYYQDAIYEKFYSEINSQRMLATKKELDTFTDKYIKDNFK